MSSSACVIGIALASLVASRAGAEPASGPQVEWSAPPGCPQVSEVRAAMLDAVARSAEPIDVSRVALRALVRAQDRGFTLELMLRSPSGESRERLHAARCETFVRVVALKVVLAANPDGDPASAPLAAESGRGADAQVPRDASVRAQDEPTSLSVGTPSRMLLAILGGPAAGTGQGLGVGIEGSVALELASLSVELGAIYGAPGRVRYESSPSIGAELALLAGLVRFCDRFGGAVGVSACGGIELGALRGRGFGTAIERSSDRLWAAAAATAALTAPIAGAFRVRVEAQGLSLFARPSYSVRNLGLLYRAGPWGLRAFVGVDLALW